jgi:hypothetical protein
MCVHLHKFVFEVFAGGGLCLKYNFNVILTLSCCPPVHLPSTSLVDSHSLGPEVEAG